MPDFDYSKPFDIMVGYWVGIASIYGPNGKYLMSTKSYISVYWRDEDTLSFRESGEDDMAYDGPRAEFINSRRADERPKIKTALATAYSKKKAVVPQAVTLRELSYDFTVKGAYCETDQNLDVSVRGRQTRPEAYQFQVKKKKKRDGKEFFHHVYNSHHMPSPDDWHIIGPIVGPVKNPQGHTVDGEVGLSVTQFFRRISYDVPVVTISDLVR